MRERASSWLMPARCAPAYGPGAPASAAAVGGSAGACGGAAVQSRAAADGGLRRRAGRAAGRGTGRRVRFSPLLERLPLPPCFILPPASCRWQSVRPPPPRCCRRRRTRRAPRSAESPGTLRVAGMWWEEPDGRWGWQGRRLVRSSTAAPFSTAPPFRWRLAAACRPPRHAQPAAAPSSLMPLTKPEVTTAPVPWMSSLTGGWVGWGCMLGAGC